jgi:NitT/TauT family transport system substrate-binding protein
VFGQLTKRDGSFLISKTQVSGTFDWATDLANKTVIAGRKGGLPAMTFEWICNTNGLYNSTNITLDTDTSFNMMVPVFESTSAEFCTMFEPTASEFVNAGKGYMVGSVGEKSGEIPYTCFMANPSFISKNSKLIENFLAAIKKAYDFIVSNDSTTVAQSLKPSFDSTSLESLALAVDSYKAIDAWCSSPVMTQDSYSRLIAVMSNAGEIDQDVAFSSVVDNTYASKI